MSEQTVTVRRGGSYLTIDANAIERYLAKGYDVVDNNGNVVTECVPSDIVTLQKAFIDKSTEIKRLSDENKALKTQIEKLLTSISDVNANIPANEKSVTRKTSRKNQ